MLHTTSSSLHSGMAANNKFFFSGLTYGRTFCYIVLRIRKNKIGTLKLCSNGHLIWIPILYKCMLRYEWKIIFLLQLLICPLVKYKEKKTFTLTWIKILQIFRTHGTTETAWYVINTGTKLNYLFEVLQLAFKLWIWNNMFVIFEVVGLIVVAEVRWYH